MKFILFGIYFFLAYLSTSIYGNDVSPCGDWEQYKDEHCYKLFDETKSHSDAEKVCSSHNASLVSIHYAEEQNFLNNFLFIKKKAVDNVWIGAKYVGNKQFQWADYTPLTRSGLYQNWAAGSPKNISDYCVQILADVGLLGKWVDEPCARKNLVVCQQTPTLSLKLLSDTVIAMKNNLLKLTDQITKLSTAKIQTDKEITQLKKESVPIGFTYVQLPKDKAPHELWPSMIWKDVSADYKGVFFRVVGGNASDFGKLQQYNAPRLETVYGGDERGLQNKTTVSYLNNMTIPVTGWSGGIASGFYYTGPEYYMSFKHTDVSEVRPVNMAIKVYRRMN